MNNIFTKTKILNKVIIIATIFILIGFVSISPMITDAQTTNSPDGYTLLEPLPCIPGNGVSCDSGTQITSPDFSTYVQYIFNLFIAIAAVSAVFMIVWGGFQYMSSDSFSGKNEGLTKLQNAIYGLLLVLSSFLILKTIDPRLVAIPSTLVDPLKLNYKNSSSTTDFFNQIASEAANYRAQNLVVVDSWVKEKALLTQLETQKQEMQKVLENPTSLSPQQIELLKAQMQNIDNQITDTKSKIILSSTESKILTSTAIGLDLGETSNPTTNTVETVQKAKKLALSSYVFQKAELEKIGNPADKVQQLNNIYFSIHGSLVLQENSLLTNTNPITYKINQINQMLSLDLPQITDPVKKAALKTSADNLLKTLNSTMEARRAAGENIGDINSQIGN